MKRDNRQRGTRNKKCRARPNICALPFRECSSSTPWKEDLSLVSDTATVAGCPRGRRRTHSRTDPSHSEHYAVHMAPYGVYRHSFMHGQRCHSCRSERRCGGRRTAAGEEAVPNLHCKCFFFVVVVRVRVPDRPHYLRRSRANPSTTASGPVVLFADLPLRPVSSSCASRNSSQNLSAASRTLNVSARMCHSTRSSLAACCRDAIWRTHSVSVPPQKLSYFTPAFLYLVQRWCMWTRFSEHQTNSSSFHSDEERLVNLVRCSGTGRVSYPEDSSRSGFRSGCLCVHPAHVLGDT